MSKNNDIKKGYLIHLTLVFIRTKEQGQFITGVYGG